MKKYKKRVLELVLGGLAIFTLGIFIGYQLDSGKIASIQGYLFNAAGEATSPNATSSYPPTSSATSSNPPTSSATNSNATNSNATNSNATNSNAQSTDNILYLQSFNLITKEAKAGERVYISMTTVGACLNGATLIFKNESNNMTFSAQVNSIGNNPYILLPYNLSTASYVVTDILLTANNSDNTSFSKHYSNIQGNGIPYTELNVRVNVTALEPVTPISLKNISIDKTSVKVGEKVGLKLDVNVKLTNVTLIFRNAKHEDITIYVKSLDNNPYFEIPSTVRSDTYVLDMVRLNSEDNIMVYCVEKGVMGTAYYDFNISLQVLDNSEDENKKEEDKKEEEVYIYNNEDLNNEIISKLYNASEGIEITINADANTLINEELFNAIKGKNKTLIINNNDNQFVFDGRNITSSKTIDANIKVDSVKKDTEISKHVSDGVVVTFADNGYLPGKAKIRIKASEETTKILGSKKVYVYFYNEDTDDFCLTEQNVSKIDGYYEFTVNHNSRYLLVNKKLDDKLVVTQSDDNVVSFLKGNGTYLLLIGMGLVLILAVIILIICLKKKKKDVSTKPEAKKDDDESNDKTDVLKK